MPRFDYKCDKCGQVVEIDIRGGDYRMNAACLDKTCDGTLVKQLSAPAFILKGSGWTPKGDR